MKRLLLTTLVTLLAYFGYSQVSADNLQYNYSIGINFKNHAARERQFLPKDTLTTADSGALAFLNGGLWLKSQTYWVDWGVKQINDSSFTFGGDTLVIRNAGGGGGSGSPNSNIGAGFRIAVAGTNNVKTLFVDNTLLLDSSSNTNGLTFKVDTAKISTVRGLKDSMYRALNSMPMTAKIEFVQSGDATTYQNNELIGKYILMVSGEGYIYGTVTRSSGYYSFNAGTGTITIHNSQFSDDDYVLILYRTTPIYLVDEDGNFVVDGNGNYIIAN